MANVNITGAVTNQLISGPAKKMRIQVNSGWTGTVVIKEGATTGTATTVGTITNPSTGYGFEYWDVGLGDGINTVGGAAGNPESQATFTQFNIWITTTNSAGTTDITVNTAGNFR